MVEIFKFKIDHETCKYVIVSRKRSSFSILKENEGAIIRFNIFGLFICGDYKRIVKKNDLLEILPTGIWRIKTSGL